MIYLSRPLIFDHSRPLGKWGLCKVDGQVWIDQFLAEHEKAEYASFTSPRRRREWLSSRVVLKKMLVDLGEVKSPLQCFVKKDRLGCPSMKLIDRNRSSTVNCSISHKNGFAAGCVSWDREIRPGIDLECVSEKPFKLRGAFCNGEDLLIGTKEAKEYYTVLWACKEAASKSMGVGLLKNFKELIVKGDCHARFTVFEKEKEIGRGIYEFLHGLVVTVFHRKLQYQGNI